MEISTKYDPSLTEDKWYRFWLEKGYFHSEPNEKEPYTVVIPPPNVTGVLHMGHMLNNTIQDVLVRRARMMGKNACWVPGTDHASIATEAKVVAKLKEMGLEKSGITREEFLEHAWEWREKHGGIILEQLKKLGASCDWNRTTFTMDPEYNKSVINTFVHFYNKGLIYRGIRMVNWDPEGQTAVSDEEVIYKETPSKLYYLKYFISNDGKPTEEYVEIATTRPETIMADTAVCVHPDDPRYSKLKGKKVLIPLINKEIPVIEDEYVLMDFGTGCLKITPAHDINDYEIGIRHKLPSIDVFNDDGTISQRAGMFAGVDRFVAKDLAEKELRARGNLVKVENYDNKIGRSERTNAVIEPRLSLQWFLKMKEISKPALEAVMDGEIHLHPAKFRNLYRHWMENVHDWCISRQLWWGHRIPAWYYDNSEFVVAENEKEALELARKKSGRASLKPDDLRQDEDVLDTWFSSWLWPITSFDGINHPENPDYNYYYPTNDLITAPEILFFWVARMIIAGYEYKGEKPFSNVYLTGLVRDQQRRKMSKSLGNSPEPIELIEKYGADGVRVGMLLCSAAGNDLLFDEDLVAQGRNFSNKIWNSYRLLKSWKVDESASQPEYAKVSVDWFSNKLQESIIQIDDHFEKFRISEALMSTYLLFWDDFSAWYLEMIKPAYQAPIDEKTYNATLDFFETLLGLLHPFMPFITEELWQNIKQRGEKESIMFSKWPEIKEFDKNLLIDFETCKEILSNIRTIRKDKNLPQKNEMLLFINKNADALADSLYCILSKLGNLSEISHVQEKVEGAASFLVKTTEYYLPLGNLINVEEEIQKLSEELDYAKKFLQSVETKLANESFVKNAPAKVVEMEQ